MAAGIYNFEIEQGASLTKTFCWKDNNDALIDLTGYTARMQLRPSVASPEVLLELTTENDGITLGGLAGTIVLNFNAEDTAALPRGGMYDIELIIDGYVTRLLKGKITLSKEVTRDA